MKNVTITINGIKTEVPENYTVMHAAEELGINIPRLCFLKDINETSSCRLCVVDVQKMRGLKNSCTLAVADGMEIETDTEEIHDSIVQNLELLASNHVFECWACEREHNCELLQLMREYNVENVYGENKHYFKKHRQINNSSDSIVLDSGKCILCGRCVTSCEKQAGLGILDFNERGNETYVGPALMHSMADSGCISCGKCIQACPVGAIKEQSHIDGVVEALRNSNKKVIVSVEPSVLVTLGEEFGTEIGENVEGKVYKSLELLGFEEIMDANFSTDLTVLESATELIDRLQNGGTLPLFTSYSPGWINYVEQYEPDYLNNLSNVKSPQQMAGTVAKQYYSGKLGFNKEDIVFVSITPSVAAKDEANRPEMQTEGIKDVDYVLTTREYARLLKRKNIDFLNLEDGSMFGELSKLSGGAPIYSEAGSIMESSLKAVSEILGETNSNLEFKDVRGLSGVKETTYTIGGEQINIASVQGGINIKEFFKKLKKAKKKYHFVEFMACEGGNINGGGAPIHTAQNQDNIDIIGLRLQALNELIEGKEHRNTRLNPIVTELYKEWLGEPGNHKAQTLLHTTFKAKKFYTSL